METVVCERPLVAPKDRLLGAEVVMNMKIVPAKPVQIYVCPFKRKKNKQANLPYAISMSANIAKRITIKNQTCPDWFPKCRAVVLINGKVKKIGMRRDIA